MSREPEVAIEVPAESVYLAALRHLTRTYAARAGFPERTVDEIQLAVDEVCSAVVARSDDPEQRLRLELGRDARKLWVEVTDRGYEHPLVFMSDYGLGGDELTADPLGYVIVSAYMDEVDFQQTDAGSLVRLVRALPGTSGRLRRV